MELIKLRAELIIADKMSANKRIYTDEALSKAFNKYTSKECTLQVPIYRKFYTEYYSLNNFMNIVGTATIHYDNKVLWCECFIGKYVYEQLRKDNNFLIPLLQGNLQDIYVKDIEFEGVLFSKDSAYFDESNIIEVG